MNGETDVYHRRQGSIAVPPGDIVDMKISSFDDDCIVACTYKSGSPGSKVVIGE